MRQGPLHTLPAVPQAQLADGERLGKFCCSFKYLWSSPARWRNCPETLCGSGLALIGRISRRGPQTKILVFSMYDDPALGTSALEAGASGYLRKDAPSEALVKAMERVRPRRPYLSHQLAVGVVMRGKNPQLDQVADLTLRQLQMLTLPSRGKSYALSARELELQDGRQHGLPAAGEVGRLNPPRTIRKAVGLSSKLAQSKCT